MATKQKSKDLLYLLQHSDEAQSVATLHQRTGIPERTLRRWLNHWVEEGLATRLGQGKSTRYQFITKAPNELGFLKGLPKAVRESLLKQLRDFWSHHSTALEGNTLTLGDTHFLLEEGLTVSGKPLKDHQEVIGHASAIELLYQSLEEDLSKTFLFDLHKAILSEDVTDIYKPNGAWKVEKNGSYTVLESGQQTYIEYALPQHAPVLMEQFIQWINEINISNITIDNAHQSYAKIHAGFVHIHPFWDGNGRLARLIANLPLLKAGLPPLLISTEKRREYIQLLAQYQHDTGQLTQETGIWPDENKLVAFSDFCKAAYGETKELVKAAVGKIEDHRSY